MPSIASQMPVVFASGAQWDDMSGNCKGFCGQIEPHRFTGLVSRPFETVATVEAVGVCAACRLLTRYHFRLHAEMCLTGLTDRGWARWTMPRLSLLTRLLHRIRRLTQFGGRSS